MRPDRLQGLDAGRRRDQVGYRAPSAAAAASGNTGRAAGIGEGAERVGVAVGEVASAIVPDKRALSARRSGTHNHRDKFGEDSELSACSITPPWGWVPAPPCAIAH